MHFIENNWVPVVVVLFAGALAVGIAAVAALAGLNQAVAGLNQAYEAIF